MQSPVVASHSSQECKRKMSGLTIRTDMAMDSFPEYVDPFESSGDTMTETIPPNPTHKMVDQLKSATEPRHPSPQPTHLGYPLMAKINGNGHRVLRSATVGYVSPEFTGKTEQMKQGRTLVLYQDKFRMLTISCSQGVHRQGRMDSQRSHRCSDCMVLQ